MKSFHQNLLIILALALCVLCAYQWYGQTVQRKQVDSLNQLLDDKLVAIQGYTNSIKTLDDQVAQMDAHITDLKGTIKTNEQFILTQKRELNRLEAENESLTNQVIEFKLSIDAFQTKLKEAYDGIKQRDDAIQKLVAQRDEFVQKLNDSVKDRNDIVAKYNELAARYEKLQGDANPSSNQPRPDNRWLIAGICLALIVLNWIVFGQTLGHEFVNYDDDAYVYENPVVQQGLTAGNFAWAFAHAVSSNWHPLTVLSHMLDCQLFGLKPGGHHQTNHLLHDANAVLLFLILRRMTNTVWPAAFVAAVFAIHPLRVESVAWIAERKDVLSGFFFMLVIAAYWAYARQPKSLPRYFLVLILFVLGLMSKPMLVTLPVVLLLLDFWPLRRFPTPGAKHFSIPWPLILEKLPLVFLSIAICVTTLIVQHKEVRAAEVISFTSRIGNAIVSCATYAMQLFYPANLAVFYPYPAYGWSPVAIGLSFIFLAGVSALAFHWRVKRPYLLVGWLWYLVMLLPVIGLVQVGSQARADRYTYLPEIGLCLALTWMVVDVTASWRNRRPVLGVCAAVVLAALVMSARAQAAYWHDSESLWKRALAVTSNNAVAESNLANYYLHQGRLDDAITHATAALAIKPDFADAHNCLGYAQLQSGHMDEAIPHFLEALKLQPDFAAAHNNFGMALLQSGRPSEAVVHLQAAVQIQPDSADAQDNLGVALLRTGQAESAVTHYEKALALRPDFAGADNNLAWALATSTNAAVRDGPRAVQFAEKANQLAPNSLVILRTLAAAYAEAGRFPEALKITDQAGQLAASQGRQAWLSALRSDLGLYQSGQPLRDTGQER